MATITKTMKLVGPDLNDKKGATITALADNFVFIDGLFPVGTIYQSTKNINPGTFIGGVWTALTGRVLIGAGTEFPAGTTGGEKEHTLLIAEIPAHRHSMKTEHGVSGSTSYSPGSQYSQMSNTAALLDFAMADTGGNQAHNNMPPYRSIYIWERTE